MSLVIDTSILIGIRNNNKNIIESLNNLKKKYPSPPKISFMSYFEFIFGIRRKSEINKVKEIEFISGFNVIQTTKKRQK